MAGKSHKAELAGFPRDLRCLGGFPASCRPVTSTSEGAKLAWVELWVTWGLGGSDGLSRGDGRWKCSGRGEERRWGLGREVMGVESRQ